MGQITILFSETDVNIKWDNACGAQGMIIKLINWLLSTSPGVQIILGHPEVFLPKTDHNCNY